MLKSLDSVDRCSICVLVCVCVDVCVYVCMCACMYGQLPQVWLARLLLPLPSSGPKEDHTATFASGRVQPGVSPVPSEERHLRFVDC